MTVDIYDQRILILDFGSQYTQLIARRVRELNVYCEIHPFDMSTKEIESFAPSGIILSGGPQTVTLQDTPRAQNLIFELGCPVLGICYGMQTMAQQFGGKVSQSEHREFGFAKVKIAKPNRLLHDIADESLDDGEDLLHVWMSHGDKVTALPAGFSLMAASDNSPIAGMFNEDKQFYAIQFHPEVTHTRQGKRILANFIHEICGCKNSWTKENIIDNAIESIQKEVKHEKVILGLSGGVDSSVVAALLHKAIGARLICIFVDTGLLRLNEKDQVMATFAKHMGVTVKCIDAEEIFLTALKDITDPEEKRKIAGRVFIEVFQQQAKQFGDVKYLAQGTIYPDVIESAAAKTGKAEVIKSHHNVGGLPDTLNLKLIEPLRELFKDEVREIGLALGLPYDMIYRHPFPGPGLALRILGPIEKRFADILRHADHIFIEELKKQDLYYQVSQAFAVFLPIKSVAVKGDARYYEYVITLRAVKTIDFMTAENAPLPHPFLQHVAGRICNECAHVSRVVYDITSKPPATIEWE